MSEQNENPVDVGLQRIKDALTKPWDASQKYTPGHQFILNDWSEGGNPITIDQLAEKSIKVGELSNGQKRVLQSLGHKYPPYLPSYEDLVDNVGFKSKRTFLDYLIEDSL